jgi:hypothetical protein
MFYHGTQMEFYLRTSLHVAWYILRRVYSPPDPTWASKCFQKAFEPDPQEAYAARRLAEGFAEE